VGFCSAPTKQKEKHVKNQFDELTKSMAQTVTRRAALKKFGVGLAGMALACFGLANKAEAQRKNECVLWSCGNSKFSIPYHVCGGGKPTSYLSPCKKRGVVDCGFCPGCC